jgi:hypothetical protein
MSGVNQITIVGNVGSAPELSYSQNNVPFCRFSVAVNEQWKSDGEKREKVTFLGASKRDERDSRQSSSPPNGPITTTPRTTYRSRTVRSVWISTRTLRVQSVPQ